MKNSQFSAGYNLPKEINEARKRLWEEAKRMKSRQPRSKCQIVYRIMWTKHNQKNTIYENVYFISYIAFHIHDQANYLQNLTIIERRSNRANMQADQRLCFYTYNIHDTLITCNDPSLFTSHMLIPYDAIALYIMS